MILIFFYEKLLRRFNLYNCCAAHVQVHACVDSTTLVFVKRFPCSSSVFMFLSSSVDKLSYLYQLSVFTMT